MYDRIKRSLVVYALLMLYVIHKAQHLLFDDQQRLKLSGHPVPAPVIIIGLAVVADYIGSFWPV